MSVAAAGGGAGLDIAAVLQETFDVVVRNARAWIPGVFLLSGLPRLVLGILDRLAQHNPFVGLLSFCALIASAVCGLILSGALIHSASRDLDGEPEPFAASLSTGANNWLILLGSGLITGVGVVLGGLLLIIPGVIIALAWSAAWPAVVLEGQGVGGSLQRSADLTHNHRWAIFGFMLLLWVGFGLVESILLGMGGGIGGYRHNVLSVFLIQPIVNMANAALVAASGAVLYHRLRALRDGGAPEALSDVFR